MDNVVAFSELPRNRILNRLIQSRAKVIWLTASAGYGKSTVARQFASRFPVRFVCDCAGVRDAIDLAARIRESLAAGDERRLAVLSSEKIAGSRNIDHWIDSALADWRARPRHSIFIFENAESIAEIADALDLVRRLQGHSQPSQALVICSRSDLQSGYVRGTLPHETMILREADLAFDSLEISSLLAEQSLQRGQEQRVAEASQGWPIAVLLLARFAREGRLDEYLDRLEAVAADALERYVVNEIVSGLSEKQSALMVAIAAVPNPSVDDIRLLFPQVDRDDLFRAARTLPFVTIADDGAINIHPLISAAIRQHNEPKLQGLVRSLACACQSAGRFGRAGLLFLSVGDRDAAISAIEPEGALFLFTPSIDYATVVQNVDVDTLLRHPAVWAASVPCRAPIITKQHWLDEAIFVWSNLSGDTSDVVRLEVASAYANALANLGRFDEGLRVLEDAARVRKSQLTTGEVFLESMLKSSLFSRKGMGKEAMRLYRDILPICTSRSSEVLLVTDIAAREARADGNRCLERATVDHALRVAEASRLPLAICYPYIEAAFGAWLAGEDDLCMRYVSELLERHPPSMRPAVDLFLACAQGALDSIEESTEHPRHRCYGYLMATGRTSGEQRKEFAWRALQAADLCGEFLNRVIARVAYSTVHPNKTKQFLREALEIARRSDSENLIRSVEDVRKGRWANSMFAPLIRRLKSKVVKSSAAVRINVLSNRVLIDNEQISLTDRESELLMYLAAAHRAVAVDELAEVLWPDSDRDVRDTGLRVYINRIRTKLGAKGVVLSSPGEYHLSEDVAIDVVEITAHLSAMRRATALLESELQALNNDFECLCRPRPPAMLVWRWFPIKAQDYQQMARDIGIRLAQAASERNGFETTLNCARMLLQSDPCDETACEIAIRAHLAKGDKAGATLELRRFAETLKQELGTVPSAHLDALVRTGTPERVRLA